MVTVGQQVVVKTSAASWRAGKVISVSKESFIVQHKEGYVTIAKAA